MIGPGKYCAACGNSSTHKVCYACLEEQYNELWNFNRRMFRAHSVALVEAKSEVTVASCLPKLD